MNTYDKRLRVSSSMESIVLANGWAMAAAGSSAIKRIIEGGSANAMAYQCAA